MSKRIVGWLGTILSITLVVVLVKTFDVHETLRVLARADLAWIALGALVYFSLFALRGLRWAFLLRSVVPISALQATDAFIVGAMANNLLPARLGDVARALLIAKKSSASRSSILSTVLLERLFDGVTVVLFLSLLLWSSPANAPWIQAFGGTMGVLFLGSIPIVFLLAHSEQSWLRSSRLISRLVSGLRSSGPSKFIIRLLPERIRERTAHVAHRVREGLGALRSAKDTAWVALLSVTIWLLEVVVYAIVAQAFDLSLPWSSLALVMCVLTLGLTAPSSPGFVGVYEGLMIATLSWLGVTETALPFAIAMHVVHFLPATAVGLVLLWRNGLRLREMGKATAEPILSLRSRPSPAPRS